MHKNVSRFSFLFILITCCFFITTIAHSASIKSKMAARIPAINSLKTQGAIGENNVGLLEYRSASKPQQDLIAAENKDRKLVYKAIGKQQGVSAALVGKRRAKQIVAAGKTGQWFQKTDGNWYKK